MYLKTPIPSIRGSWPELARAGEGGGREGWHGGTFLVFIRRRLPGTVTFTFFGHVRGIYVYEEPPPRPAQFTSLARLTVIACAHCCEVPLIQSLRHPNGLVDKDRMCYDDRSGNILGSRDLPNVYQEPACLRRSDPFGDTCTRRTLTFGIATIALSFVACLNFVLYHL